MTTTNFVIANIKLLIEISEDGNYRIHEDRTHMDFHPCAYEDLPPIRKNEDGENVMQSILDMVSSSSNKIKWEKDDGDSVVDSINDSINDSVDDDDDDSVDDDSVDEEPPSSPEEEKKELEEKEPRVYTHELQNRKPKQNSLTTTLKNNYVKNNITKKQR